MPEPQHIMQGHELTPPEQTAFEALLRLLRLEWDPTDTDGVPDDDYEGVARVLFNLLAKGGTVEEATNYLGTIETIELGLPERRKRNADIAATAHTLVSDPRPRH